MICWLRLGSYILHNVKLTLKLINEKSTSPNLSHTENNNENCYNKIAESRRGVRCNDNIKNAVGSDVAGGPRPS